MTRYAYVVLDAWGLADAIDAETGAKIMSGLDGLGAARAFAQRAGAEIIEEPPYLCMRLRRANTAPNGRRKLSWTIPPEFVGAG
jgi:hypothetical protein